MSRLVVPLKSRKLKTTEDTVLWAELDLSLKTSDGTWVDVTFRVDPGTEMTTMPAYDATSIGLPIPREPVRGLNLGGQAVRSGLLRARIVGMDETEFVFPCYFLGDPETAPTAPMRNLLGLTGVINQIGLTMDGGKPCKDTRACWWWRTDSNHTPLAIDRSPSGA